MVRTTIFSICALAVWGVCAFAEGTSEDRPAPSRRWIVETDDLSAAESLNRISGEIDTGFTASGSDQTYDSDNHYPISPFARQQQADPNGLSY